MELSTVLRLSHQVENEYKSFHNELQKLEVLEYPTKACSDLISELDDQASKNLKTIQQIRTELVQNDPSISTKLYRDSILTERRKLFGILTNFLEWINSAQTQKVPWSLIPSVERLAQEIIPKHATVLYCKNLYNYGIHWHREVVGNLDRYSFISLPKLHRTNILMHTLIGHELFHPCCEQFTSEHENKVAEYILTKLKNVPNLSNDDLFGKRRLDEINKYLMVMWERGTHELLCDMFCAEIFGPAALLAMRALASFSELKTAPAGENNFYPPMQYRFEVVWQHAIDKDALGRLCVDDREEKEIAQSFRGEVKTFGESLESDEGYTFICRETLNKIAYNEVNELMPQAHRYVKGKVPMSISKWTDEKVLKQIPKLVHRLKNGIPPNEIPNISFDEKQNIGSYSPEPAELPAILIAGWMYQIYREKNGTQEDSDKELLSYDTLSRLLLKACEDSEMLRCNTAKGIV